mmetsp:Transcript_27766/g.32877  ORF Transcript_27766/g.32877 Transcript_27766/m.32877 type:complete len:805 (+) Transcript_27766:45-2459(+)
MSDIGSRSSTRRGHGKSSRSAAPVVDANPSAKPSQSFWDKIQERETELINEQILIACRKCIARVVKSEQLVVTLNKEIIKARDVNDLSKVASLRIEEKAAEKNWKYFVEELHKYLDGPDLPEGELRDGEIASSQPLFDRFDAFFDTNKPRPPSPPNGPIEFYSGEYSGNVYDGAFLPWKRERHGEGQMKYGDGTRIVGTFVRDQLHGAATLYFNDRLRAFVGGWRRGQRHGHGILETKHGVQYISWEGKWKKGLPNGIGTYTTRRGHRVFGEWRKPKLLHGGRTIRFNYVKVSLPGRDPELPLFEGKAELENAGDMRLRILHFEHNKLYKEYGGVDYDLKLTKKCEAREREMNNEVKVTVRWLCHVCFYENGESDDESLSDSDAESDDSGSDDSEDYLQAEEVNEVEEDDEDDDDDDYDDDDEDDEEDDEDEDMDSMMDMSLFWATGEMASVWQALDQDSSVQDLTTQRHVLKHQLTIREELTKQAGLELKGWMMECGITLENAERYEAKLKLDEVVGDPMDFVTEMTETWRRASIRQLVDIYKFKQRDAEMLARAPPFSVDLGDFTSANEKNREEEDEDEEDIPPPPLPLLTDSPASPTSLKSSLKSPEAVGKEGIKKFQLFAPISPEQTQHKTFVKYEESVEEQEQHDLKEPTVVPQEIDANIEELIQKFKDSKPNPTKAPQFFKLPRRMSMRSKSISLRRNGSFASMSPTSLSSTSPFLSTNRTNDSMNDGSTMVVRNCRACGCPDTSQLRLGPLGRLRAAKMIDPISYPRNVRHIRARREMAKDIWLGQPYDPEAFKAAH